MDRSERNFLARAEAALPQYMPEEIAAAWQRMEAARKAKAKG